MNTEIFLEHLYRVMNLYQAAQKKPRRYEGDIVLYAAEAHMLELIGSLPGITGGELTERLAISKGAVSQTVKKLADKGLICRMSSEDGRIQRLTLSPSGEKIFACHRALHEPMLVGIRQLSAQFTPEMEASLEQLTALLEEHLSRLVQEDD